MMPAINTGGLETAVLFLLYAGFANRTCLLNRVPYYSMLQYSRYILWERVSDWPQEMAILIICMVALNRAGSIAFRTSQFYLGKYSFIEKWNRNYKRYWSKYCQRHFMSVPTKQCRCVTQGISRVDADVRVAVAIAATTTPLDILVDKPGLTLTWLWAPLTYQLSRSHRQQPITGITQHETPKTGSRVLLDLSEGREEHQFHCCVPPITLWSEMRDLPGPGEEAFSTGLWRKRKYIHGICLSGMRCYRVTWYKNPGPFIIDFRAA